MLAACRPCARPEPELLLGFALDETLTFESTLRRGRLTIHPCPGFAHVVTDEGEPADIAACDERPGLQCFLA